MVMPLGDENRPGADGVVGTAFVAHANPDGHTLLLTVNSPITMAKFFQKDMTLDTRTALTPVLNIASTSLFLAVNAQFAANNVLRPPTRQQMLEEYALADRILVLSEKAEETFLVAVVPKEKLFRSDLSRWKGRYPAPAGRGWRGRTRAGSGRRAPRSGRRRVPCRSCAATAAFATRRSG